MKKKKEEMRMLMQQKIKRLQPEERSRLSESLCARIRSQEAFQKAKVIMMYYPIQNEPDLRPLMDEYQNEKVILLPIAHRKDIEMRQYKGRSDLHRGHFGIPEPTGAPYTGAPDLIIVPGVAFDKECNRLGRGGGYYDRFLKRFHQAKKYAVAYDFQIVEKVPMAAFDAQIDGVFTVGTEFVRR
ncbi:MAG: 5-formyltetrahydrofolate cyclo-ligase [Paludibacteraceae bacterium]|nr:5-formyltetrahydrofolate cyclo-ligase [Paludibacteraceae bacterium]MBQ3914274.1 5-formyltetrahydrofolate cyclo-ligase [Paludibacteraceae bacterium]MBQ7672408.1 5-formyltetrahydrofolate cyclo-ligase [Paludibacteraceae bacterium]MBR4547155.1 5-formyltetrahydrofolate cyclo-ligase [Paludibacteraceae bacterium]MBR6146504.1 5-formyltetrahydrofolate cyclo-ligase [Paludibacteraceae bacterium]